MQASLKDKYGETALITGASSGIGHEFAIELAKQGINLILVARRLELLDDLRKKLIIEYEINVTNINADLSTPEGINKVIEETSDYTVSILVNNAGFGETISYQEMDNKTINEMISVNCTNYALLTNHFAIKMIKESKGAIFIISSIVGSIPVPYMSLYSSTKAFNLAFGEALWYEFKKHNIDVCTVCPGSTETEFKGLRSKGKSSNVRSVSQVVDTAFRSIGKKVVVTDGFMNKFNMFLVRFVPRSLRIKTAGKVADKILNQ